MPGGWSKTLGSWSALVGAFSMLACSSALPPVSTPPAKAPERAPSEAVARRPDAVPVDPGAPPEADSAAFVEALSVLRPPGTEQALQTLVGAPTNAEAYAQAALAYAPTEVPSMTLLWGLSYQAMGGGVSDEALAKAFARVLTERIKAKPDEQQRATFSLRLAPGQMPVRQAADGSSEAPLAYTFEALFGPAVTSFRPPWSIEQFYDVLSTWTGVVAVHGTPLDELVEVDGWLVTLAKSGHLEAFCYQLLGPAFPAELNAYKTKSFAALKAYRDFVKGAPLLPKRAPLPDDLVRIQEGHAR